MVTVDYRFRRTRRIGIDDCVIHCADGERKLLSYAFRYVTHTDAIANNCKNLEPTETSVRAIALLLAWCKQLSRGVSCWLDGYSIQQLCTMTMGFVQANPNIFFMILSFQRKNQPLAV